MIVQCSLSCFAAMAKKRAETPHNHEALRLAKRGIAFDARGNRAQAAQCWEAASNYADTHLSGEDIYYWIKSGLGAALFEVGDFQRSIAVSEVALDWCSKINQPLPALTIAKCYLRLGDQQAAKRYLDHARRLAGDAILDQLDPSDQAVMRKG